VAFAWAQCIVKSFWVALPSGAPPVVPPQQRPPETWDQQLTMEINVACLASEFVGTALLTFTVGCTVVPGTYPGETQNPFAVLGIAAVLTVIVYMFGAVNPAVTLACHMTKFGPSRSKAAQYIVVQLLGGALGGLSYWLIFGRAFNLAPGLTIHWAAALTVEFLFTFLLCLVVLNAATRFRGPPNEFYGLAIGFVILAGGYSAGWISGAVFNPAVALGVDLASFGGGFGWCLAYWVAELAGGVAAAFLHKFLRPEEEDRPVPADRTIHKLVCEALGSFFLVLVAVLNLAAYPRPSPAAALSIAAALLVVIYALGDISGGHFNPAVSLAVLLSCPPDGPRSEFRKSSFGTPTGFGQYIAAQLVGGVGGACIAVIIAAKAPVLAPQNWVSVAIAELVFTFLLCFVVLSVCTSKSSPQNFTGFAVAFAVLVGITASGNFGGGALNPAVAIGIDVAQAVFSMKFGASLGYTFFELLGAVAAAGAMFLLKPAEFVKSLPS